MAALNLRSMLEIFIIDLNQIIKTSQPAAQPQPNHLINIRPEPIIDDGPEPITDDILMRYDKSDDLEQPYVTADYTPLGSFDINLDQQAIEEQMRIYEQLSARQKKDICKFCNRPINEGENNVILQSSECYHNVHLECFRTNAKQSLAENIVLYCPECAQAVSAVEQKAYLDADELK